MKKIILIVSIFTLAVLSQNEAQAQSDTTFSVSTSANPFEEQVIINVTPANKNITGIKIFDAIGKEVSSFIGTQIIHKGSVISYSLDFTGLRPGIYFCSIYSDKGVIETRKLFRAAR